MRSEFGLISAIEARLGSRDGEDLVELGIGDDAAVLRVPSGRVVATTDSLVQDIHFRRDWLPAKDLGWRAAAVNLSDLAAMGARPIGLLVALGIPKDLADREVLSLMAGVGECGRAFGAPVIGGNLATGPVLEVTVTALGEPRAGRVLTRSGGLPGDVVMVGGPLGSAALGRRLLEDGRRRPGALVRAFRRPIPQVLLGERLAVDGAVHGVIDLSDGLVADLRHLLDASGVGAVIRLEDLPLAPEARMWASRGPGEAGEVRRAALEGGEDYLLLAAVSPEGVERCEARGMTPIGWLTRRRGLHLLEQGRPVRVSGPGGWRHR